jgi:O-antigen ligase
LVVIAALGISWSHETWAESLGAVDSFTKLLMIPLLLTHANRSRRGAAIAMLAYVASVSLLLIVSWLHLLFSADTANAIHQLGVPVKSAATQSREFIICGFALLVMAEVSVCDGRVLLPIALVVIGIVFLASGLYVVSFPHLIEALTTVLVLGTLFFLRATRTSAAIAFVVIAGTIAWTFVPPVSQMIMAEWHSFVPPPGADPGSWRGGRGEFWRQSVEFIGQAPLIGHGTGSTPSLFEKAPGSTNEQLGNITINPHQQTLAIGIQLGLLGMATLWAMWLSHLLLFWRRLGVAWIGTLVVAQNITGSLFDSLLFDFTEGWFYVLAVGTLGGTTQQLLPLGPKN